MNIDYKKRIYDIAYVIFKNVFVAVNGIILSVVALLFYFGDTHASLFLGLVLLFNIFFAALQDLRAWYALEKLQSLIAPKVTRIGADGKEESIFAEQIKKGDLLQLRIGDQVLCDGIIRSGQKHF